MTRPCETWIAPDLAEFERIAHAARLALPVPFAGMAKDVAIRIEDFAPPEMLSDMDITDPYELTGLYDGIPLTQKSSADQPLQPDMIWLFRRPILEEWAERGNIPLGELITHVLVHELAHHFGWSDDDIAAIDRWWE